MYGNDYQDYRIIHTNQRQSIVEINSETRGVGFFKTSYFPRISTRCDYFKCVYLHRNKKTGFHSNVCFIWFQLSRYRYDKARDLLIFNDSYTFVRHTRIAVITNLGYGFTWYSKKSKKETTKSFTWINVSWSTAYAWTIFHLPWKRNDYVPTSESRAR